LLPPAICQRAVEIQAADPIFRSDPGCSRKIQKINETNFKKVALTSLKPVPVDCCTPWCLPCRAQYSILKKEADELQGKTLITSLDA
jgi:thioredoxin-like negative regulator of GroEL